MPSRSKRGTLTGQVVAGHELIRVLAVGGMAEVYLAKHQTLGMQRVIKVIRTDLRTRDKALERFTREAHVLARLQHNSIVQIVEFGSLANGWPFLAMEYIDGPNIEQLVGSGPLPLPNALVVLEQLAIALSYAHSLSIIHRDLKPSNILVRSGDVRQVKIIDFGFARMLDEDLTKTLLADEQIGSPAYMAPEQAGATPDVTAAVDVYALGGIAYTLLSGAPPFAHRKSAKQLLAAHGKETPPRVSERCPTIPESLDTLLHACLAKDPAQRPPTDDIAAQLTRVLHGAEIAPRAPQRQPARLEVVASPWAGRRKRSLAAQVLDSLPHDSEGRGETLTTRILAIISKIASDLSASDPALTSLLALEASIRDQLGEVERELDTLGIKLELAGTRAPAALVKQHDTVAERIRALQAQQKPLQRRLIDVVEGYRRWATPTMKSMYDEIDRALDDLDELRRHT